MMTDDELIAKAEKELGVLTLNLRPDEALKLEASRLIALASIGAAVQPLVTVVRETLEDDSSYYLNNRAKLANTLSALPQVKP